MAAFLFILSIYFLACCSRCSAYGPADIIGGINRTDKVLLDEISTGARKVMKENTSFVYHMTHNNGDFNAFRLPQEHYYVFATFYQSLCLRAKFTAEDIELSTCGYCPRRIPEVG